MTTDSHREVSSSASAQSYLSRFADVCRLSTSVVTAFVTCHLPCLKLKPWSVSKSGVGHVSFSLGSRHPSNVKLNGRSIPMNVVESGSVANSQLKARCAVGDVEGGCGLPYLTRQSRGREKPVSPASPDRPDRAVPASQLRLTTCC